MKKEIKKILEKSKSKNFEDRISAMNEIAVLQGAGPVAAEIIAHALIDDHEKVRETARGLLEVIDASLMESLRRWFLKFFIASNAIVEKSIRSMESLDLLHTSLFDDESRNRLKKELYAILKTRSDEIVPHAEGFLRKLGVEQADIDALHAARKREGERRKDLSIKSENARRKKETRSSILKKAGKVLLACAMLGVLGVAFKPMMTTYPLQSGILFGVLVLIVFVVTLLVYRCPKCGVIYAWRLEKKVEAGSSEERVPTTNWVGNTFSTVVRRQNYRYYYRCRSCDHHWMRTGS